jgi:hypothetical protein
MSRPNIPLQQALDAIAELRAEVAELRAARFLAPAAPGNSTIQPVADPLQPCPPGTYREPGTGILRSTRTGAPWFADADTRPYHIRQAAAKAEFAAEEAATLAEMRKGLPHGQYRDFSGLIRDERTGKLVPELMPDSYAPPVTENSPPSLLIPPHPETLDGHPEMKGAVWDETAELMRLRAKET